MDLSSLSISIPTMIGVVGCFIGLMTFFGNRKKNTQEDERRLVRMETMLVKIDENTSDLKNRVDNHDHFINNHETRITVLEEKVSHKKASK